MDSSDSPNMTTEFTSSPPPKKRRVESMELEATKGEQFCDRFTTCHCHMALCGLKNSKSDPVMTTPRLLISEKVGQNCRNRESV